MTNSRATERRELNEQRRNEDETVDDMDAHNRAEFSGGGSTSSGGNSNGNGAHIPPHHVALLSRQTHPFHPGPYQSNYSFFPQRNQFASGLGPHLSYDFNSYINTGGATGHAPYHNRFPRRGIGPTHPSLPQNLYQSCIEPPLSVQAFHPHHHHGIPPPPMGHGLPIPVNQEPTLGIPAIDNEDNGLTLRNFEEYPAEMKPLVGDYSEGTSSSISSQIQGESSTRSPGFNDGTSGGGPHGISGMSSENDEDKELTPSPESLESSDSEQPIGTAPIFHPLPSMFSSFPRPLSFPMTNTNKELPTLALFSTCNLESKVVTDYADSHQELSLMLALPGLSTHQAPLLSLQQAGDILQAINNPLVVLKVGRLTRKLVPSPALLRPTEDVGTLALWLSPTSDVRLFWHSFLKGPSSESARELEEQIAQCRFAGEGSPYRELFSHVELSEELAWVAAESDQMDGGTGIRLEMMDHDPSGRAFKLTRKKSHDRHKTDLASKLASEEKSTGEDLTAESQKLRQLLASCMSEDSEEEDTFFFWIAESSLSEGVQMLNTMQNRLDHLPTLAGVSGVPEKKLHELFDWFSKGQEAASNNSDFTLSHEISSWIDLRSGASVPSQLFSNTCPANVPNWSEAVEEIPAPSTSTTNQVEEEYPPVENTIREGCALSATANFLVADKKWGLTHLATASVMVAVGVECTGFFYDEEKAHKDASHCAHELAKKRAEAGASAEAERLGRIRLEELVAVKSQKEMKSNKVRSSTTSTGSEGRSTEVQASSSSSSSMNGQPQPQRAPQHTSVHSTNGNVRPISAQTSCTPTGDPVARRTGGKGGVYLTSNGGSNLTKQTIFSIQRNLKIEQVGNSPGLQGNSSFLHNSLAHEYPNMASPMHDYWRQHVHYAVPIDQSPYPFWKYYPGESGTTQVVGQAPPQYEHPSAWSVPRMNGGYPGHHQQQWPYNGQASSRTLPRPSLYQPQYEPLTAPAFYPRHLPPPLPFMQMNQLHGSRRKPPNIALVRIAQEAREKVARDSRDRVRPAPSGSNLAASNVHLYQDQNSETYAWHNQTHQLDSFYSNTLNVQCKQETTTTETTNEARACAETPRKATADDEVL